MMRMDQQRGRPLLVEFWDFCRPNSIRTLPYMTAWHERYESGGLRVIGVHDSGFAPSADPASVREAVRPTTQPRSLGYPRVTAVIPALNEAENLPHVLASIPTWVHEVIVVDGDSTDGTPDVARATRDGPLAQGILLRARGRRAAAIHDRPLRLAGQRPSVPHDQHLFSGRD